tara:strand:- start:98 stop:1339 length:1242 start_codon:yes stop_codon:yes gene_type:complete
MNLRNLSTDIFLKYIIFLFPIFIIIGNAAINFALMLVLVIYFFRCFREKKIIFFDTYEFKYFCFFYIYLLVNSFQSEDIQNSLIRTIFYIKFFVFALIYQNFIEEKKINLKKLGIFWFIIILILCLDIIHQSILGYNIFNYTSVSIARNSGLFFDELVAGGFLLSFVFIIYFLIFKKNNYLYLYLVSFLIIIYLTGERSNFLKFTFVFLCIYFTYKKAGLTSEIISLLVSGIIILFILTSFTNIKNRYLSTISFSNNKNLSLIETYLTSEYGSHTFSSYLILKDNLFFGVGNKNFRNSCKLYSNEVIDLQKKIELGSESYYPSGCATHPHQIYNEFLSEHGIFGTLIMFYLFFKLIFKNLSINKTSYLNLICFFYIITYFIPILPSGSFFSTLTSILFWFNFVFYKINFNKYD